MDYFKDVYLQRVNRFGNNIQSRVHGQMEHDFENKLKKSVNKVDLYKYDNKNEKFGIGILESQKIDEKQIINYLCTRIDEVYDNGFMFYTQKPFSKDKQVWMIVFKEQYQTIGYNRYKVILLENELSWIGKDGLIHSSYVHYVGDLEKIMKDQFKISFDVALGTPSKTLSMICPYNDSLKRDLRININDSTWRICGYDKISVPGIMYITLEEDYVQKGNYANEEELGKWSIISSQGYELGININEPISIDFYCSYNGVLTEELILLECNEEALNINHLDMNKFSFEGAPGIYHLVATLKNAPLVKQNFTLELLDQSIDWVAIVGPQKIKVLQTLEFELSTSLKDYEVDINSEKDCFVIDKVEGNKVYIRGINIGKDNILVTYEGITYSTPLEIISPWM